MKPCPRCVIAHWQTGGQTKIHYIPEFMELCRDCCDPGEDSLNQKEKEQFNEFVRKQRDKDLKPRKKKMNGSAKKIRKPHNSDDTKE